MANTTQNANRFYKVPLLNGAPIDNELPDILMKYNHKMNQKLLKFLGGTQLKG